MAYVYNRGTWSTTDDGIKDMTQFHRVRAQLGFKDKKNLDCITGSVTLYSRTDHTVKWEYPHLALLQYVSGYYWIWITDLPGVFQFLKEIQAKYDDSYDFDPVQGLLEYMQDSYFSSAMKRLYEYLDEKDS